MSGSRAARALAVAVLATLAGSCAPGPEPGGGPTPVGDPIAIAYLAPAPAYDARYLAAFRGAEVALAVAALEGVDAAIAWVEVPEDLAGWTTPAADAAIVAPGTPAAVVEDLAARLTMPVASLAGGRAGPAWRALAAGDEAVASAMRDLGGEAPCLLAGTGGHGLATALRALGATTAPARLRAGAVVREPTSAVGCTAILWTGAGDPAVEVRAALARADLSDLPFVAAEGLRDGGFATSARVGGRGVLVVTGATDLAERVDLRSRRYVQDYQAQVGRPPAPFSAEGTDAADLLMAVLRAGWPSTFPGIARRYDLASTAEPPVIVVRLTRAGWRER